MMSSGGDLSLASLPPTAPGGGEFGAPLTNRTDTVDESNIGGPSRLKLKIAPAPPQYPYADTYFNLEVYVVDQHESLQRGEELPLSVTLTHYVSGNSAPPGVLNIDQPNSCVISKSGNCTMRIKISDDKTSMERRRFRLKVEAINRPDIEPAVTEKLTVIRNRLEIRENPENPVPDHWYKDEGGRENCVELQVHLLGPKGDEVKSRRVPLRLVLMYENMHRVHNQEILKLSPDSKLVIDEHGKATLRVRIEEVSKNHQKQAFRIKVEPDVQEQPLSMDISPVVSKPITVLSKRINKPGKGKRNVTPVGGVKRPVDPGYVASISRADQSSLERRVNFSELISPSAGQVDTTNVSLYEALKSVIEWTGQVVNGLQAVQWQLLGYESKSDGQPDHDRPLYSMSNPNPVVNSIVRRYATDTMTNLHVLLKRIEAGSFDDPVGSGGGGNGGGARAPSPSTPVPTPNMHSSINSPTGMHHLHSAGSSPNQGPHQWEGQGQTLSGGVGGSSAAGSGPAGHHHSRATPGRAVGVTVAGSRVRNDNDRMLSQQQGGGSPGHHPMQSSASGAGSGPGSGENVGSGGGAVGAGGQPPSKRPRTSPVGGGVGPGGAGNSGGAGSGNGSGKGMTQVGNGAAVHHGGAGAGNAVGGSSGGNGGGGGGNGGPSDGSRSTSPARLDDTPPTIPTLAPGGLSQMIVTRGAGSGGNGRRNPNFPFPSPLLPSFSEGPPGGNAGETSVGQPSSGGTRLRDEPSLPTGVTDPSEVDVFFILAKGYLSHELGMLGFPAYDRSQILLGFYKEVQSQGGQTQVVFIPAHRIPNLDDRDTAATTEILREEMRKGSQSIISYDSSNGSLEKMREDAFMYYWSKSMIIDMESNEAGDQQGAV